MSGESPLPPGVDRALEARGEGNVGRSARPRSLACSCAVAEKLRLPRFHSYVAVAVLGITLYYLLLITFFIVGHTLGSRILGWLSVIVAPVTFLTQLAFMACAVLNPDSESRTKVLTASAIFFVPMVSLPVYYWLALRADASRTDPARR